MSDRAAWGYVRLSQRGREGSIDEQKAAVREYTAAVDDVRLVTTLNEGAETSGFNADRPKYTRLVEKMEDGAVDAVVVRDRARLSRDFDERLRLLTLFRNTGTEFHVVEAGGMVEIEDVQTAAMECVHAAMDHIKKMAEIERSREAIQERMEQGHDHGRPRFGMEYNEAGTKQVPGEDFDKVMEILRMRRQGASYAEIADELDGVSSSTAQRVVDRSEWYIERTKLEEAI